MNTLFFGLTALLGAWLLRPQLQVEHEPVVGTSSGATATATTKDDRTETPATPKAGRTMR